jgi:hypothetical protein
MPKPKKQKLSIQLHDREPGDNTAPAAHTRTTHSSDPSPTTSNVPSISDLTNLTYDEYKAFNLSISQQHALIGRLRDEVPLMDVHNVDNWLLESLAKQLETCIFPTAKMMHIDPAAVRRMLDIEFRKAYGQGVETSIIEERQ